MTIALKLLEKLQQLPAEQQQEVLDFVEYLAQKHAADVPRENPFGLWGDLGVDITEQDITQARAEMWCGFPREDLS